MNKTGKIMKVSFYFYFSIANKEDAVEENKTEKDFLSKYPGLKPVYKAKKLEEQSESTYSTRSCMTLTVYLLMLLFTCKIVLFRTSMTTLLFRIAPILEKQHFRRVLCNGSH